MAESWWVGKDRAEFNEALATHTDRLMRGGKRKVRPVAQQSPTPAAEVAVLDRPAPVPVAPPEPEPAPPPAPRKVHQPWRPGSRGHPPARLRPILAMAKEFRAAIDASEEGQLAPPLARAAVVLVVGFFFRQQVDWIVTWTGYPLKEVLQVAGRLKRNGVWCAEGSIACEWMNLIMGPKLPKARQWEIEMAIWLDAMVGTGELTRETREGQFYYGLPEWRKSAGA